MSQHTRRTFRAFLIALMVLCTGIAWMMLCPNSRVFAQATKAQAGARSSQKTDADDPDDNSPRFHDYKGVTIGMTAKEVRTKLGKATEQGDDQDYFSVSDSEMAQVYYDTNQKVIALSVNYVGDNSGAPGAQAVLGMNADPKPDGAIYKLVRFPKAGYWVSYSRTAGSAPIITITLKKLEN